MWRRDSWGDHGKDEEKLLTGGQSAGSGGGEDWSSPYNSNRVLKNPIDMCYKGPAESQSQSAGKGGGEGAEKSHRHVL